MLTSECLQVKLQILVIDTGDAYISISAGDARDTFDTYWWCLYLIICRRNYRYSWYVSMVLTSKYLLMKLQILLIANGGAYIWISSDETIDTLGRYITPLIFGKTYSGIRSKPCLWYWNLKEINSQWYTYFINKDQIFYVRVESCRHFLN